MNRNKLELLLYFQTAPVVVAIYQLPEQVN